MISESSIAESEKVRLTEAIEDGGAYNANTNWFNLNKLVFDSRNREPLISICSEFVNSFVEQENSILLIPDLIVSTYNLLPLGVIVGCKLEMDIAIWAEIGNEVSGSPKLYGKNLGRDRSCIVFQDVVDTGVTLVKLIPELVESNWKVTKYLSVIHESRDEDDIRENLRRYNQFEALQTGSPVTYSYLISAGRFS